MRRVFIFALNLLLSGTVAAENTEEFDRFFTNLTERKQLSWSRDQHLASLEKSSTKKSKSKQVDSEVIHLKGLLVRGDGSVEIWLNKDGPLEKSSSGTKWRSNASFVSNESVRLSLSSNEYVFLKPGQIYNIKDRKIREGFGTSAKDRTIISTVEDQ